MMATVGTAGRKRILRVGCFALTVALVAGSCGGGGASRVHQPTAACPAPRPPTRAVYRTWPPHGLILDDESYSGVASWTAEGLPPAGDRCSRPPAGVTPSVALRP